MIKVSSADHTKTTAFLIKILGFAKVSSADNNFYTSNHLNNVSHTYLVYKLKDRDEDNNPKITYNEKNDHL